MLQIKLWRTMFLSLPIMGLISGNSLWCENIMMVIWGNMYWLNRKDIFGQRRVDTRNKGGICWFTYNFFLQFLHTQRNCGREHDEIVKKYLINSSVLRDSRLGSSHKIWRLEIGEVLNAPDAILIASFWNTSKAFQQGWWSTTLYDATKIYFWPYKRSYNSSAISVSALNYKSTLVLICSLLWYKSLSIYLCEAPMSYLSTTWGPRTWSAQQLESSFCLELYRVGPRMVWFYKSFWSGKGKAIKICPSSNFLSSFL